MIREGDRDHWQLRVCDIEFRGVTGLVLILRAIKDNNRGVSGLETAQLGLLKIFVTEVFRVPLLLNSVVDEEEAFLDSVWSCLRTF